MADTPRSPENGSAESQELLPGWSSLVILLLIFAVLGVVTLAVILRGGHSDAVAQTGGTRPWGPADFSDVEFDAPLLDAVAKAGRGPQPEVFNVPPPPFSDDSIFPCSECHADMDVDLERRELVDMHDDIVLDHGPPDRWCFDCHNPDDRDYLRLANGTLIAFDESYRLCGQCHGTIYRDWREGIHGRRRGYWDGAKSYLLCAHCHNPHHPRFAPIKPLPPPVRPELLRQSLTEHGEKPHE